MPFWACIITALLIAGWETFVNQADDNVHDINENVLRFSSSQEREAEKWVPLFYMDDKLYQILSNPSPTIGLEYLEMCDQGRGNEATAFLLKNMLTEEGFAALMDFEQITQDQFDAVMDRALEITSSNRRGPKGRTGSRGRRR